MISDSCMQSRESIFDELFRRYLALSPCRDAIDEAFLIMASSYRGGGKLLVCGNGGSAADCEHIEGELMKSFRFKRSVDDGFALAYEKLYGEKPPTWLEGSLPAICLPGRAAFSTAYANDETATGGFAQQVYGLGNEGDVLLAISTSGTSENVVQAARVARAKGMKVVSLIGSDGAVLSGFSDVAICAPESETFKVQELHLPIYHCLCAMLEAELFG